MASFSPDGKWIATTGFRSLRLWDATTGKELWARKHSGQALQELQPIGFIGGGNTLVVRGNDNTIRLFDRATGKQQRSFPTLPRGKAWQCALAPDGSAVVFGQTGPALRVWEIATGKERPPLGGHKEWARCVAFSPDGNTLVSGSDDPFAVVRAWPSGKVIRTIELGRRGIERMAVSGDGRRLGVLFWGEQALHFYDLNTGKCLVVESEGHQAGVWGAAVASDGKLLSFGKDRTVRTWDVAKAKAIGRLAVDRDLNAGGFAVSGDGRLLATPNSDTDAVHIYERATGKRVATLPARQRVAKYLAFSADGRWLAGADRSSGIIQVWDVGAGRAVAALENTEGVTCAFSPDSRQFAAATARGRVRFWDVGTWKEQAPLAAYATLGLAYSPDGRTLAAASVEGIRLVELAGYRERGRIRPKDYPGGVLVFSRTGRWLAWTGSRRSVCAWDVRRDKLLGPFRGHDDTVTGLAFTPDDRGLVSTSEDSTLLVWDLAVAAK